MLVDLLLTRISYPLQFDNTFLQAASVGGPRRPPVCRLCAAAGLGIYNIRTEVRPRAQHTQPGIQRS